MSSFAQHNTNIKADDADVEVDEDQEEGNCMYGLFVSEDYIEKEWHFQDNISQRLLCSNMSSTDHDLTGQIVWPASILLGYFIAYHREMFGGKHVLELGAGCGLGGFLVQQFAHHVHITDGNDIVLRLLDKNLIFLTNEYEKESKQYGTASVGKLMWGLKSALRGYWQQHGYPDFIIGADIILWPNQIRSLLYTIRWSLFARLYNEEYDMNGNVKETKESVGEEAFVPKALISYVIRAHTTTELLYQTAKEMKLSIEIIDRNIFVPEDCHVFDRLETKFFVMTLTSEAIEEGCDVWNEEVPEIADANEHLTMPC